MEPCRIAVAVPTIVPHGMLDRCIESILAQALVRPDVLLIQNGPDMGLACTRWEQHGVVVYRPGRNLGVAASWNYACRWAWGRSHQSLVLLNDDIALTAPQTLSQFQAAVTAEPRCGYVLAGRGFAAFCFSRVVWEEVGPFDEGFWPAYLEDSDMQYRMKLRGIPWDHLDLPSEHFLSASIRSDEWLQSLIWMAYQLNKRRYVAKWGGLPEEGEIYTLPWNGAPPLPSVRRLLKFLRQLPRSSPKSPRSDLVKRGDGSRGGSHGHGDARA